jgi:cobalamin biosynthesis Mg chelatase CobN
MKTQKSKISALLLSLLLLLCLSIPAFAGSSVSGNTAYITSGTKTVTSDDIPASIVNRVSITTIYVPNSVTRISSGAFTSFSNLETVYIDNYQGGVTVESGALPSGAKVVYTGEKPTTTRKSTTTKKSTTTTSSTTESTTESETEEPTEEETSDSVVTKVANPTGTTSTTQGTSSGSKQGRSISIGVVTLVGVSAVVLMILKFRKQ